MSARDLPPLPWSLWRVPMTPSSGRTDLWVVRDADQHIVLETEHEDVARAIASNPIQALLRGEAVAVPKEPTEEMREAGLDQLPCTPGGVKLTTAAHIYRAMLAASPFAKEGKE